MIIVSSYYVGKEPHTDVSYNVQRANDIMYDYYWRSNIPAICLVTQWQYLGDVPAEETEIHEKAQRWCLRIIEDSAHEVHFWFPTSGLSKGMQTEWDYCGRKSIPRRTFEVEEW